MLVGDVVISLHLLLLLFHFIILTVNQRLGTGIEAFCKQTGCLFK